MPTDSKRPRGRSRHFDWRGRRTAVVAGSALAALAAVASADGLRNAADAPAAQHAAEERYYPPGLAVPPPPAEEADPYDHAKPRPDSVELAGLLPQVDEQIAYASELAAKGAIYAAEARFIRALDRLAWALDHQQQGQTHRQALAAALQAMREVDDFARMEGGEPLVNPQRVPAHKTPVLAELDPAGVPPLTAAQAYLQYAQAQFAIACGQHPVGAQALYGLGRLHALSAMVPGRERPLSTPKAITLFEAALAVDGEHAMAANELGVLLYRCGALDRAEEVLLTCTRHSSQPEPWHNLAVVYEAQGKPDAAQAARQGCRLLSARDAAAIADSSGTLRWVEPAEFVRVAAEEPLESAPAVASDADPSALADRETHREAPPDAPSQPRGLLDRLGSVFRP